jgi:hypothetical protein
MTLSSGTRLGPYELVAPVALLFNPVGDIRKQAVS